MLKTVKLTVLFSLLSSISFSQVGIGTNTPSSAAILEISSTSKGFLPPRMTASQRNAIAAPVAGLEIWCIDCGSTAPYGEAQIYNGTAWTNLIGGTVSSVNTPGTNTIGGAISPIGIGTSTPAASAALELNATNKGFLIPRMTATQRNAIMPAPTAAGLQVWCTDCNSGAGELSIFNGVEWTTCTGTITLINYPQDSKILLQFNSIPNATDYVIHYKLNSDSTWSIYNDGVNTNLGTTVDGLTNGILYDFMVKAIVSSTTAVSSNIISSSPTTIVGNNVYHQILATGQSLVFGWGPSLTRTPLFNNKMINVSKTELIPLREPWPGNTWEQESTASALGNFISSASFNNNGFDYKSIVTLSGQSGTNYLGLKKGTVPYSNGLLSLVAAKKLANLEGIPYVLGAFYVIHGEIDMALSASIYKSYLEEWQNDLETDSKLITGQTGTIPLFLCQLSRRGLTSYTNPNTPIGQLNAAEANPTKIFLVTPKYMLDYADGVHIPNYSQRRLGEYYGKVMKKVVVDGVAWKPLSPSSVSISANVITVDFYVPVAPLQFDTTKVMSTANYGFEYYDATNSATITNVAIGSNGTSVIITLSNTPTGANKKIAYAYSSSNDVGGRYDAASPKGNLRDSDTTPALYTTGLPANYGTELNNWCVHFIKDLN